MKAARSTGKPDSAANPSGNRGLPQFAYDDAGDIYRCPAEEELTYRYTTEEDGLHLRRDRTNACRDCPLKYRCTTGKERRITRWEHEHLVEEMQRRIGGGGGWMRLRRATVEHPFGTIKA
ncbi:transposase [Palleronia rufa]|uniref:transposase n=1 Tax=Palleronia rufa TaxID=1530186 RepID=UPI003899516A